MNIPATAELLRNATEQLASTGIQNAARDARILLADAISCDLSVLAGKLDHQLSQQQARRFSNSIASRSKRQPVAQIIGRRDFWRHTFCVTPDVLDPRPETETLLECASELPSTERILDLGTGSGCLAISLLLDLPGATAIATDISSNALSVASQNARDAGVSDRLHFVYSNWFDGVDGEFDLVVCNPPYISASEFADLEDDVRLWEPKTALTPGGDGLAAYRVLAAGLSVHLGSGGTALFEIGHRQARSVCSIFRLAGYTDTIVHKDLGGADRVVEIRQSGTTNAQSTGVRE